MLSSFPDPKKLISDDLSVQSTVQSQRDSSFTVIDDKEKQQILLFIVQEPENISHFCFQNDLKRLIDYQTCWQLSLFQ